MKSKQPKKKFCYDCKKEVQQYAFDDYCQECYDKHLAKISTLDPSKCFVCQSNAAWLGVREDGKKFRFCDDHKRLIECEIRTRMAIEMELLYPDNNFRVFSYTLGMKVTTPEIKWTMITTDQDLLEKEEQINKERGEEG